MAALFNTSNYSFGQKLQVLLVANMGGKRDFTGKYVGMVTAMAVPSVNSVNVIHQNMWPAIPDEIKTTISDNYRSYQYIVLEQDDGTLLYIGTPWIIAEAVVVVGTYTAVLTISPLPTDSVTELKAIMEANGYTVTNAEVF